jgi:hypothetical protein
MEDKKKTENGIAQALRLCKLHFAVTTVVTKENVMEYILNIFVNTSYQTKRSLFMISYMMRY